MSCQHSTLIVVVAVNRYASRAAALRPARRDGLIGTRKVLARRTTRLFGLKMGRGSGNPFPDRVIGRKPYSRSEYLALYSLNPISGSANACSRSAATRANLCVTALRRAADSLCSGAGRTISPAYLSAMIRPVSSGAYHRQL